MSPARAMRAAQCRVLGLRCDREEAWGTGGDPNCSDAHSHRRLTKHQSGLPLGVPFLTAPPSTHCPSPLVHLPNRPSTVPLGRSHSQASVPLLSFLVPTSAPPRPFPPRPPPSETQLWGRHLPSGFHSPSGAPTCTSPKQGPGGSPQPACSGNGQDHFAGSRTPPVLPTLCA